MKDWWERGLVAVLALLIWITVMLMRGSDEQTCLTELPLVQAEIRQIRAEIIEAETVRQERTLATTTLALTQAVQNLRQSEEIFRKSLVRMCPDPLLGARCE